MVNVLLVDDSEYIRDVIEGILLQAGHSIAGEAVSGDEAVEKYERLKPDLVLMDIVLESGSTVKTGLDALKKILQFDNQANVVICSGLNEQSLINESMSLGAKGFVAKPVEPEKLLETVVTCSDLSIISEMGNIGAGRAATVLSKLVKQPIEIDVPKIETTPPHLISLLNGSPERPVTAIYMSLEEKNDCDILLAFDLTEASKISEIMTQNAGSNKTSIQQSALKEMGSNTICAFFSAIADFTEIKLVPSPPVMVTDIFESVVDVFLAKMAIAAKTALSFQIRLRGEKKSADGILIIFPSPEFQKQLIAAGKRWLSPESALAISA